MKRDKNTSTSVNQQEKPSVTQPTATVEPPKKKISVSYIRPDNERVKKMYEQEAREKEEKERQKQSEKDKKNLFAQIQETKKIENEEEKKKIQQQTTIFLEEERYAINKKVSETEGNLYDIFRSLKDNVSPFQINFAGLDLNDSSDENFEILMFLLMENKSLHTLNLSRKKLTDKHAKSIADMLKVNKTLRRLELEGNYFGPEGATAFAEALKVNKTLRYLDLENNNMTNFGTEKVEGIPKLFQALKENRMLISLNLNNNYLDNRHGDCIIDCLNNNKILIHLDIGMNQNFIEDQEEKKSGEKKYKCAGLSIDNIIEIKRLLNNNREDYNKYRKKEWQERKKMLSEFEETREYTTTISHIKHENIMKKQDMEFIENHYTKKFQDEVDQMEKDFINNVNEFMAKTKERLERRGKKKKGGGKKKK